MISCYREAGRLRGQKPRWEGRFGFDKANNQREIAVGLRKGRLRGYYAGSTPLSERPIVVTKCARCGNERRSVAIKRRSQRVGQRIARPVVSVRLCAAVVVAIFDRRIRTLS